MPNSVAAQNEKGSKRLVRGSALMLLGRVCSVGLNFFVQVLIVRALAKSDFGAFSYAMSFVAIGSSLSVMGLGKTFSRFAPIYQERQEFREMAGTVALVLGTVTGIGVSLVLLIFTFQAVLTENLASDPQSIAVLMILAALIPFQAINNILEKMFAVFANPKSLFLRRYIVGPGLKLMAVLSIYLFRGELRMLATAYVIASVCGAIYSIVVLVGVFRRKDLLRHFRPSSLKFPARRLYAFSVPLILSDLMPVIRIAVVTIVLDFFHGTTVVAAFRAVIPVARLNHVTIDSFKLLFAPTVSRMYARDDQSGIEHAYWTSSAWIAVLTFPFFIVCISSSDVLTGLLFGDTYASSAVILSVLAVGFYASAIFGFGRQVLRAYGRVRTIFRNDATTAIMAIASSITMVYLWQGIGAAAATSFALVFGVAINHWSLYRLELLGKIEKPTLRLFGVILCTTTVVMAIRICLAPSFGVVALLLAIAICIVTWSGLSILRLDTTFPELQRFLPFLSNKPKQTNAGEVTDLRASS